MKPEWTSMNLAIENLSLVVSQEGRRRGSGRHRVDDRWALNSTDGMPGQWVVGTRELIGHSTDARSWVVGRRLRAMSSAGPLQCPILVGRDDILELFDSVIADALEGRSSTVFLAGQAGLGKTRLILAADRKAEAAGLRTA